jgi:hypothetical protein
MATLFLFTIIAALIELLIVLYATSLGVKDGSLLQWSFKFPGAEWNVTLGISPLFHLVPLSVVITLVASWIYLAKHLPIKRQEMQKAKPSVVGKPGKEQKTGFFGKVKSILTQIGGTRSAGRGIRITRTTVKSAITILVVFLLLVFAVSLIVYPRMIFETITGAYASNPSLLDFVKGTGQALASAGSVFSSINDALVAASPGFRDFAQGIGGAIGPLANMDGAGKYLAFQNVAAWVSAFLALFYGEYGHKSFSYKKK